MAEIDPITGKPRQPTTNLPYGQPGQLLPLSPTSVQPQPQQPPQATPQGPQPAATPQNVLPIQPITPQQPVQPKTPGQSVTAGAAQVFNPNLSQQVVQTAQQTAMQGVPNQTANLVSQQTQALLKDPSLGKDYSAGKTLALDQLARKQSSDLEAMRQAQGGTANLGINLERFLQSQLGQRAEATDLSRQYDMDIAQQKQADMIKALAAGKETVGMEQGVQSSNIDNMIKAAGGALGFAELASKKELLLTAQDFQKTQDAIQQEYKLALQSNDINAQKTILEKQLAFEAQQQKLGFQFTAQQNDLNRLLQSNLASLDAATQKELVGLKAAVDKDMLLSQQDFQATQASLERQFQEAMKKGDYAQAQKMQLAMNDFEMIKQKSAQDFAAAQNLAQNAFAEKTQMSDQQFKKAMEYINLENQKALKNQDFDMQKILMDKQSELEFQKMTQGFKHDEKMTILKSELDKAKAAGDLNGQKELMQLGHKLQMTEIEQKQGFDKSMAYVNNELQKALQNNDHANAKILQKLQFEQEMKIHTDQMSLNKAKLELEKAGIDMAKIEMEYNKIQDLIKQGQLDPSDAVDYVANAFKGSLPKDFKFTKPDPNAVQKALDQEFITKQYQFAQTQGVGKDGKPIGAVYDKDGKFVGLTDEMQKAFSDHMKQNVLGQTGTPMEANIIALKAGEIPYSQIKGPSDPIYQALAKDTSVPKLANNVGYADQETGSGSESRKIIPALENNKFININGTIYAVTGFTVDDRAGDDRTAYTLVNVANGKSGQVWAIESKDAGEGFNLNINW